MSGKYKAVWISHSGIADFLKCPRLYYLRGVYKDPKTSHRITIITPPLALGQAVHDVIESLSIKPLEKRFEVPLFDLFEKAWENVEGEKGGFKSKKEEKEYKERGKNMIKKIMDNPGPLKNRRVKLKIEDPTFSLPHYLFNEDDNIILDGKIDWLEYLPDTDTIHIIDFKTGKNEESDESLQLPIYYLLTKNLQGRKVSKISYWYLDENNKNDFVEMAIPNENEAYEKIYNVAKRIKLGRQIGHLKCPKGEVGCFACRQYEQILKGNGKLVGTNGWQDIYILPQK